ncbi:MAG: hypothetical protein ACXADY_19210 [Candidatus Hodarchaeales archaeon]|jgi:hypothetical protein
MSEFARKLAEEYQANYEKWEAEARKERKKSVNWELVNKRCSKKQIEAIKLFVEYRLYEGAASIAEMTMLDFVLLLDELGISRG